MPVPLLESGSWDAKSQIPSTQKQTLVKASKQSDSGFGICSSICLPGMRRDFKYQAKPRRRLGVVLSEDVGTWQILLRLGVD